MPAHVYVINRKLTPFDLFRYVELTAGIICGCMPVFPKFYHHLAPKVTQKLSFSCSRAQDFLGRFKFFSRITDTSTALPQDSNGNSGAVRETKREKSYSTLGSFGGNGLSLSKMIRAVLPSALTLTSLFHSTKWASDDSTELESQKENTKTGPEDF